MFDTFGEIGTSDARVSLAITAFARTCLGTLIDNI
jgi:hypothetical protein